MSVTKFLGDVTGITDLRQGLRQYGAVRFGLMLGAVIAYIIGGVMLMLSAQWSGTCDVEGRKLVGFFKQLGCSPELLTGGAVEIGLFFWLWSGPVIVLGVILWVGLKKFGRKPAKQIVE